IDLFTLGAELACVPGKEAKLNMKLLDDADAARLEAAIDEAETRCAPLKYFVLPGGSPQAAALHLARTVCRRAERAVLALEHAPPRAAIVNHPNPTRHLPYVIA